MNNDDHDNQNDHVNDGHCDYDYDNDDDDTCTKTFTFSHPAVFSSRQICEHQPTFQHQSDLCNVHPSRTHPVEYFQFLQAV